MTIDRNVINALIELGKDISYLSSEEYTKAEWDNLADLKAGFPTTYEGIQLTNGVSTVNLIPETPSVHSANVDDNDYFAGVMRLKAEYPELPVYEIHNHPSVEGYIKSGFFFDDGEDDWKNRQRLASSVPSIGDTRRWNSLHNLVGAGIYVQDLDEIRIWREGDERIREGSRLAIEHDENRNPLNAYWAPEDENNPNTVYIRPEEWESKKDEWLPYFNKTTFADAKNK